MGTPPCDTKRAPSCIRLENNEVPITLSKMRESIGKITLLIRSKGNGRAIHNFKQRRHQFLVGAFHLVHSVKPWIFNSNGTGNRPTRSGNRPRIFNFGQLGKERCLSRARRSKETKLSGCASFCHKGADDSKARRRNQSALPPSR